MLIESHFAFISRGQELEEVKGRESIVAMEGSDIAPSRSSQTGEPQSPSEPLKLLQNACKASLFSSPGAP